MPDLLLLDLLMASSPPWHVVDLVKLDPRTAKIPIVVGSVAGPEIRERETRLRDQGIEVLEKPFQLDALVAVVERLIGQGKPVVSTPYRDKLRLTHLALAPRGGSLRCLARIGCPASWQDGPGCDLHPVTDIQLPQDEHTGLDRNDSRIARCISVSDGDRGHDLYNLPACPH
jgi:hypothetical protein